jgi:hypothetical protein
MYSYGRYSNHCLAGDHKKARPGVPEQRPPLTPKWMARIGLLMVDPTIHLAGPRAAAWRILGVTRSPKNPNVCNL